MGVAFRAVGKLRKALQALSKALGIQEALHGRAVSRMKARHAGQKRAERQAEAARDKADDLRREAHTKLIFGSIDFDQAKGERMLRRAERKDTKAGKLAAKAISERERAIHYKQRARTLARKIAGIEQDVGKIREEIKALGPTVNIAESKVTGGSFAQRWRASNLMSVQRCSEGMRRNAYSQEGAPDIWHPYGPGPASGKRDDCSTYNTSQALASGADDPNGLNFNGEGFTGTQAQAHGRWVECTLQEMIKAGQGYIIYGSGSGHHVEDYCPSPTDKMRTAGHGSPPVDFATIHIFGTGEVERYFCFKP